MGKFIGRQRQLAELAGQLRNLEADRGAFVWMHGPRRVGKSRLVEHFCSSQDVPYVYFTARGRSRGQLLAAFAEAISSATSVDASDERFESWTASLRFLSDQASMARPAIVVIDDFPELVRHDADAQAEFQAAWDQYLQHTPVMLICIGSDVAAMERYVHHDHPLAGRPTLQMRVPRLNPAGIQQLLGLESAAAIDSYLITGGLPDLVGAWKPGEGRTDFLSRQLATTATELVTNAIRVLDSELRSEIHARLTLDAIGNGQHSFGRIQRAAGLSRGTLDRTLRSLTKDARLIERDRPVAAPLLRDSGYRIVDPYLHFWLRFIAPFLSEIDRGCSELVIERIGQEWNNFSARAVIPVVAEAINRRLPDPALDGAAYTGSFWTRGGKQVDLVGVDDRRNPTQVNFIGAIKWVENELYGSGDLARLESKRKLVPGVDDQTKTVIVSREGCIEPDGIDAVVGPDDLLTSWQDSY